jgi:hypothetical protein
MTQGDKSLKVGDAIEKNEAEDYRSEGVEEESEDESLQIDSPFDPEKIRVRTKAALVEAVVRRIERKEIDLAPPFQRLAGIWKAKQKSRLIESLMLRIPLPVFYVAADQQDNWTVVDGLQRMTTIKEYFGNQFSLSGLTYLAQLTNLTYCDLPRSMQRRIDETELVIHIIEPGTPDEVMFNIFRRINTGGSPLNGQEIRHAMHKGPARDYLRCLAESDDFLEATCRSVSPDRMADRECVLRFLAFRLISRKYYMNELDGFLSAAMLKINELSEQQRETLAVDFHRSMAASSAIFGNDAFRKPRHSGGARSPINKALFEAWGVALADCSDEELNRLGNMHDDVEKAFRNLVNSDPFFVTSISASTGDTRRVQKRFDAVESIIKQCLEQGQ